MRRGEEREKKNQKDRQYCYLKGKSSTKGMVIKVKRTRGRERAQATKLRRWEMRSLEGSTIREKNGKEGGAARNSRSSLDV